MLLIIIRNIFVPQLADINLADKWVQQDGKNMSQKKRALFIERINFW